MNTNENRLLKIEQVLNIIPMSVATWYRIVNDNPILRPIKIGRGSFWRTSVIENFINESETKN